MKNITRSRSSVMIQLEDESNQTIIDSRWNASIPTKTPMSKLLIASIQNKALSFDDDYINDEFANGQTKQSKVGPEQFREMLRRKNMDLAPTFGRRRTMSENQEPMFSKFSRFQGKTSTNCKYVSHNSPTMTRSLRMKNFAEGRWRNSYNEDHMNNFPKLSVGSPISPLNEFCQFSSSPSEPVVIWKEKNEKDKFFKVSSIDFDDEEIGNIRTDLSDMSLEKMIENMLRMHTAYDAMPPSTRCIILDLNLKVGSAFDALAHDGIHSAPLWDEVSRSFVGMLTMTDFINILLQFLDQPGVLSKIRNDRVSKWRDHLLCSDSSSSPPTNDALVMPVDSKLGEVLTHLLTNQIHRVVIVDPDTNNALYVATIRNILKYLWHRLPSINRTKTLIMSKSIEELNIGTYENLISVSLQASVSEIFSILLSRRLSSVPVVDDDFRVVDVFRKADVMSLILEGSLCDLYSPVKEVLSYQRNGFEGVYRCRRSDSAYNVISSMISLDLHRVAVVNEDDGLEGVVSLSDVVRFLIDPDRMDPVL